jgi:hypothetical protein
MILLPSLFSMPGVPVGEAGTGEDLGVRLRKRHPHRWTTYLLVKLSYGVLSTVLDGSHF